MTPVERALERQRLLLEIAEQRQALAVYTAGLQPAFEAVDRVRAGLRWLAQHPEVTVGGVAVLAASRPGARRFIWRWGRRAFVAWRLWRDGDRWLAASRQRPLRTPR
jgi:hypothetical protein